MLGLVGPADTMLGVVEVGCESIADVELVAEA